MWESERLFLLIESTTVSLYRRQKRHFVRLADFAPDAAGIADFAKWRMKEADLPLTVLTDLPDEGFVIEAIPRLHGAERRALIQRKIRRHFPETPYAAVRTLPWQTPEKARRKEETLLFSSLPLSPIGDWIAAAKPLSGLYALVDLIEVAAKKLDLPPDSIVLTRRGNFVRQTLLRAHVPCFSRFAGGENLREETRKLLLYLARQLPLEANLPLCPLCSLSKSEQELLGAEFTLVPTIEADDVFFLSLLANGAPKAQYAPDALLTPLPGLKRFIVATGAFCLLAGVAFGAYAYRGTPSLDRNAIEVLEEFEDEQAPEAMQEYVDEASYTELSVPLYGEEREAEPEGWQGMLHRERTGKTMLWKDGLFVETEGAVPKDVGGTTLDLLKGGEIKKDGGR